MSIERLDHYSIRTKDLDGTRRFYTEALGLQAGPRPNFSFPGVWLYQGRSAVVHLIGVDPNDADGLRDHLGDADLDARSGTGALDHVAFVGSDLEAMRERFRAAQVPFRERTVPPLNLRQIFVQDPNGVTIELNFPD